MYLVVRLLVCVFPVVILPQISSQILGPQHHLTDEISYSASGHT